ncbi:hypothetical protein B5M09_013683 [Aphanomyces astaci]|uniref:Uncharacterized protein n=1 Tax=Aphanomyces astaci TaxID=112090 RepID=A0A3R7WBS8_APHAT|nr:hypothetical protein B5M09_013683 [Aphanomyces astaci]
MKFLAALLQAIAASQIVFDSFLPPYDGATGTPISKNNSVSVRFRTPPEFSTPSGILSNSTEVTLESVIFSLNTINIPTSESLWLIGDLYPFFKFNQPPDGYNHPSTAPPTRIHIQSFAKRAMFEWFPPSNTSIIIVPNTLYWFTLHSNGETKDKLPIWLNGVRKFSQANDLQGDVQLAYTTTANGNWTFVPAHENCNVPSLQVFAKN